MLSTSTKIQLDLPSFELTTQDMVSLGNEQIALIKIRVYDKHLTSFGKKFKPYSTRPFTVAKDSYLWKRLRPKGGKKTKSGGVYYKGGYAEYKAKSAGNGGKVDLTLSGNLMQSLNVVKATNTTFAISPTGKAATYAEKVDKERPFIGLSDAEVDILKDMIMAKLLGD
jgi:hypothetical protein